jgi:membrane associated rhomboid family serine protease
MQDQNFEPLPWSIKYIAGILVAVELLLSASDYGLLPNNHMRQSAFLYGAIWPDLAQGNWGGIFTGQGYVMLLSHAFLHGGLAHMAMNTVIILALGKRLGTVLSNGQLILLYATSAVAGGALYLLLTPSNAPMIGASGAAFGFFGIWKYFEYTARRRMGLSLQPIWQFIGVLVLLNVGLWFMLGGGLAWEAHLGGFIAGWLLGMVFAHRPRQAGRGPHK